MIRRGVNPVFYFARSPADRSHPFMAGREEALDRLGAFADMARGRVAFLLASGGLPEKVVGFLQEVETNTSTLIRLLSLVKCFDSSLAEDVPEYYGQITFSN